MVPFHSGMHSHEVWWFYLKVMTWLYHVTCRDGSGLFSYVFPFSECSLRDSCTVTFLICHLITWWKAMPSVGWVLFHVSLNIDLPLVPWKFPSKNDTENSYQKFIRKCDRGLLQNAPDITMCDRSLLQSVSRITKRISCYTVRQTVIRMWARFYKMRRNTISQPELAAALFPAKHFSSYMW